ncbi:hypothetical protein DBR42_26375, partial [Pelomonas sp. HMWF004]
MPLQVSLARVGDAPASTRPHPTAGWRTAAAWLFARASRRSATQRLLMTDMGVADAHAQAWPDFAAWCAAHPGKRVALFVGPQCMHSLRVPDDLPLPDDAALLGYARLQFTHYFGAAAQQWPLAAAGRVACALSEGQVAALQATALSHRVRLVSLQPSWTLAPALEGDTAVLDGSMLTWLRQSGGLLRELQQR